MPITPADIQQKTFSEAKRGYQPAEVDVFLEEVGKDIDAMLRKIADLKTRLTAAEARNAELINEVERAQAEAEAARNARPVAAPAPAVDSAKPSIYSATEEQLSAALIIAQQTADRIVAEARVSADRIKADAEASARKVIRQALDEKQAELDEIERLKVSREKFRTEYIALVQKFMDAAASTFPLMDGMSPSGSDMTSTALPRTASVIQADANPYGAQIESSPIDDLD